MIRAAWEATDSVDSDLNENSLGANGSSKRLDAPLMIRLGLDYLGRSQPLGHDLGLAIRHVGPIGLGSGQNVDDTEPGAFVLVKPGLNHCRVGHGLDSIEPFGDGRFLCVGFILFFPT